MKFRHQKPTATATGALLQTNDVLNDQVETLRIQLAERDAQLAAAKEALDLALPIVEVECAESESDISNYARIKILKVLNNQSEKVTYQHEKKLAALEVALRNANGCIAGVINTYSHIITKEIVGDLNFALEKGRNALATRQPTQDKE